jgi:hypothetical protein
MKNNVTSGILITLLISLFFSAPASAKDGYLVLNAVALHFDNFDDRNAAVPGLGWEYSPSSGLGWHVGTFSDSFGSRAAYTGINYATQKKRILSRDIRLLIGATVLHKQYHENQPLQTKIVPLPAIEISLSDKVVLNVSGSPEIDYKGEHNNAVMFFQLKMNVN